MASAAPRARRSRSPQPRLTPTRRATEPRQRSSRRGPPGHRFRGWLTLLVLLTGVAVLSLGPATIGEALSGLLFARPRAAAIPAFVVHPEPVLQAGLESVAGARAYGSVGAVVVDLQTGATASLDGDRAFPAASLFKLPILIEVLAEEDAGQLDPESQLQIRAEDWTDGSGVLQARVGDRLTVRELTRLMIQDSDNIAALVLLDAVGVPAVNAIDERLGLPATRLVDHRAGASDNAEHTTSAADMAHLLVGLATGQLVNQHVSEAALGLLELRQATTWLGDELPFWVKVAHKWGDLPQARNDVGAVFTPRGSYVVAVLTADSTPDESARIIARTSRMAYDYLGGRPAPIAGTEPRLADQPTTG